MVSTKFTNESLMPFGKYKDKKLADVPDEYLLWLHDNAKAWGQLKIYLRDNIDAIRKNVNSK